MKMPAVPDDPARRFAVQPASLLAGSLVNRISLCLACYLAAALVTAGPARADEAPAPGAALLKPFKQSMKNALMTGMARGPAQAIDACRVEAPAIAARQTAQGITVGRSSDRLRNPANAAPAWVQAVMDDYLDAGPAPAARTVVLSETEHGYVEPIMTGGICLNCHGTKLAPPVAARLTALYPDDRATGYREGDLRGVFWIRYPVDTAAAAATP